MSDTIEVTTTFRLWESIPAEERVTTEMLMRKHKNHREEFRNALLDRLNNPGCEVATRVSEYGNKYMPCGMPNYGEARCKRHGGPGRKAARQEHVPPREAQALRRFVVKLADECVVDEVRIEARQVLNQFCAWDEVWAIE